MRKSFLILGSVVMICGSIWTYRLIWGKPSHFNLFVERVVIQKELQDPEFITYLGLLNDSMFDFFSGKLTDISWKKNNECLESVRKSLAILHQYDPIRLSAQEKLTYSILEQYLQTSLEAASFGYGSILNSYAIESTPYPVNQLFGMQSYMPDFMVNIHRIDSNQGAKNYIKRLNQWKQKFTDVMAELMLREKNGVVPPRFVIEKVLVELNEFVHTPSRKNILYTSLQQKLKKIDLSPQDRTKWENLALTAIEEQVYPAYEELISFLERQKTIATQDAGVWKLPNGDAYYAHCLKYHTTTNYSPEEVHTIGLREVDRITNEMRRILDQLGYRDLKSVDAMREIGNDPQFLYPDSEEARKQILVDFQEIFAKIQDKLPLLFAHFPKGELLIKAVPDFKAKTAPLAYYEPGDLKGNRPGIFYANTSDMKNQTKFTMHTLAYHEGIPGHHFQIALAMELKDLPTFRHLVGFTAYQEGWALYCEQLAAESGFITDLYSELGRLQMELLRAARLVVDTGIHAKRWSREEAIQYMMEVTGKRESEVTVEVDRYIVLPGQACSYKIGMIKILELREKMKQKLGSSFDIRAFHDIILQNGALPLNLLEQQIEEAL